LATSSLSQLFYLTNLAAGTRQSLPLVFHLSLQVLTNDHRDRAR
jgi:hypothetical protein